METNLGTADAAAIQKTCSSNGCRAFISRRRAGSAFRAPYLARIRLFLASWVSSARPRASMSGGMYIPNLPR